MRKTKGFTIIELLVVLIATGVLFLMFPPVLRAARSVAKKDVCAAHLRSIAGAFHSYVEDYDGRSHGSPNYGLWDNAWQNPAVVTPYGPGDSYAYWGIAYRPYLVSKRVFHCPSAIRVDDWEMSGSGWGPTRQKYFQNSSYGLNGYLSGKYIDTFTNPAETILAQDHIEQKLDSIYNDMFCIGPGRTTNLEQWWSFVDLYPHFMKECFRHQGVSNTVWLDGHVSEIPETDGMEPFYVPCAWYDPLNTSGW